ELHDIPAEARLLDAEIDTLVQKELLNGLMICSYITGIASHEDIRTLFEDFHTQKATYEQKLLAITKEKGWYVSPPINIKYLFYYCIFITFTSFSHHISKFDSYSRYSYS